MWAKSVCVMLFIAFFVSSTVGRHTLHVDEVYPSATNTVTINQLVADVMEVDQADLQFINLNLKGPRSLELNPIGPILLDGSYVGFDSATAVNINNDGAARFSTPDTASLSGNTLSYNVNNYALQSGGDLFLNTDGSIRARTETTNIRSLADLDIESAVGPIELLAAGTLDVSGRRLELLGDDRISLYSFHNFQSDTAHDFEAFSAFIDFDSFGDIRLATTTGSIAMDTVRTVMFEADTVSMSAPIGIDFQSEHGEVHVNVKDRLTGRSDDLIYLETVDEARFLASEDFSLSTANLVMATRRSVNFRADTAEVIFTEADISSQETEISTGGDINFLLNAQGLAVYSLEADDRMSFDSRTIKASTTTTNFVAGGNGDIEIAADREFDSRVVAQARGDLSVQAKNSANARAARLSLDAASAAFSASGDLSLLADSSFEDGFRATSKDTIGLQFNQLVGNGERGLWKASGDLTWTAGANLTATAGREVDEDFAIESRRDAVRIAANQRYIQRARLGSQTYETEDMSILTNSQDIRIESRRNGDFSARGDVQLTADDRVRWVVDESAFEAESISFTASDADMVISGAVIDLWATEAGNFTAGQQILFNADGDVNLAAFTNIVIDNLGTVKANALIVDAGERFDLSSGGGLDVINAGNTNLFTGTGSDLSFNGNSFTVNATNTTSLNGGFIRLQAANKVLLEADKISIATRDEENVRFYAADDLFWTMKSGAKFATSDDDLISRSATNLLRANGTNGSLEFAFQRDWEAFIRSHAQVNLDGMASFVATQGNILMEAKGDITTTLADSLQFKATKQFLVDVQGDLSMNADGTVDMSGGYFKLTQQPGPASLDDVTIDVGGDQVYNLTGAYKQIGGSNAFTSASWTEIANRILVASRLSTLYTLSGAMTLDAVNDGGRIRLDASDFEGTSSGNIAVKGGQVNFSSRRNDYIDFVTTGGAVSVTSQANSSITWNSGETFNLTALAGLVVTSKTSKDGTGILFESMNTLANNIVFNTRSATDGRMDVITLDTQTYEGNTIELLAGRDFTYTNFYRPKEVGGVRVVSNGYEDDGAYEDRTGIVVRSYSPGGFIRFDSEKGTATVTAGRNINTRVQDAAAFYTSDEEQSFTAQRGNITLTSEQGDVIMRADTNNVTFTTNSDTSLTASQQINLYASNAITLESTDPIVNGDNNLSFEFSAVDGNIYTRSFASNPVIFEGTDFELVSNEDTRISASTDIPFTSNTAGFNLTALSGIFFEIEAGDFELTASDNIKISSGKNEDISFDSGDNLQVSTDEGMITFRAGKENIFRTQRDNLLIQTRDSNGDINFQGGGDIRFQADGTDDNVGASQVDGIFINAPRIQTFATDDAIFDNEYNFVVGANTRPIITLIAGGNILNPGVTFSAEAKITQEIGENFVINSAGTIYFETQQEFDFQAGGEINVISKGTNALGKDVRFETNQKSDVRAGNVEINGGKRVAFVGDNLVQLESKSTFIDINVLNILRTNINETYDINADTWAWTSRGDYYMRTRGDVRFTNGPQGTISIEADSEGLNFLSDTNARFQTTGPNAPIFLQTFGSNSNLFASTAALSSDINFRTGKVFTATADNGGRITSIEQTQINAPSDRLDTIGKSNITLTSAADTIINAQRNIDLAGAFGLSLAATLPAGADLNVASNGNILVQSWQDAAFRSVTDDVSFNADYNITYITRQGDLRLVSTRDVDVTADGNVISRYEGDYLVTNNGTYGVSAVSSAFFTTTGQDSDIVFTSRGPVSLAAQDDVVWAGGATTFRAGDEVDVNLSNGLSLTTFGEQTDIQIRSEQGLLTVRTFQNLDFIMSLTDGPFRSGTNYIDFTARGASGTGANRYSIRMEAASFNTNSRAANAFYADEKLTVTIDDTINIRAKNLQDDNPNLVFSATNDGGNINMTANLYQVNADNAYLEAEENILLLPFDTIRFSTAGAIQQSLAENDYMGVRIESHHPSADVRFVTTDFLTGDINFAATSTFNTYSYGPTTFFMLDDDDTNFVGTFTVQSGVGSDLNLAAENDIIIRELSSGDITFEDTGRTSYFTAGNDLLVTARNRVFFDSPNVDATADRGMDIVATQDTVTMTAGTTFQYRAESYFQMLARRDFNIGNPAAPGPSVRIIGGARVAIEDTDVSSDLLVVAENDITFTATATNGITIQTPPQGIIDFRDGLIIPLLDLANVVCNRDRALVFDTTGNNICFCDVNRYRCLPTIGYQPAI